MKTILALCLVILASLVTTACGDDNIPLNTAKALAVQEAGGHVLGQFGNYAAGLTSYTVLVCDKDEKVVMVDVFGEAAKPQTRRALQDLGLYCGSRSDFWTRYDEISSRNPAIKQELGKFVDLFGLKKED